MANLESVDPANFPGPANNRNAAATICTGASTIIPTVPVTGQLWPRGNTQP